MTLKGFLLERGSRWLAAVRRHDERRQLQRCASVGAHVRLRPPVVVIHPEKLVIGNDVDIGEFVHIRASGGVTIGDRVLIASHVVIATRAHPITLPRYGVIEDAPVRIDDDVWIGAGAIILPGVTVGKGAVVAAGAVVTRAVEPMTVVAGVPARLLKHVDATRDPS